MANYAQTSKNFTGQFMTGIQGLNTGLIIPWSSAVVPSGFLECNGQAVSQATYAALFAVIGTTYGNPGGGNFNVPDLTDRTVLSRSNTKSLAQTGGANAITPTGNIGGNSGATTLSSTEIAAHTHSRVGSAMASAAAGGCCPTTTRRLLTTSGSSSTGCGGSHAHTLTGTFTGASTSVLQPYLVLIYIIKT
jgi:microcystin-dependent protein